MYWGRCYDGCSKLGLIRLLSQRLEFVVMHRVMAIVKILIRLQLPPFWNINGEMIFSISKDPISTGTDSFNLIYDSVIVFSSS